jgi:DNA-3-methyladenine glycosylase I
MDMTKTSCADPVERCGWAQGSPEYVAYHDDEWGRPVVDDRLLFEQLSLEGFQAGLSWRTILAKREAFRQAFLGFDPEKVARFGQREIDQLLTNTGIVRHRGKIEAMINNAARALEARSQEGSLAALLWRYEAPRTRRLPAGTATTPESDALSKELKKRGWRFVGSTTVHAFMQAVGMVNGHSRECRAHASCAHARSVLMRPVARTPLAN